uniref:hypothetical protein n=1 Tax=Pseudomonas thivervalensis TaxID=86265 RepID=UPI00155DCD0E|nr:hypothetical protein [Pseudomonas thivervalensis]
MQPAAAALEAFISRSQTSASKQYRQSGVGKPFCYFLARENGDKRSTWILLTVDLRSVICDNFYVEAIPPRQPGTSGGNRSG